MFSGTITQAATSVATPAELTGIIDIQFKDGELAYAASTDTYYRINRSNNTGIPTASNYGTWTVFAPGSGAASGPLSGVVYVAPGTTPASPDGSIANPFGSVTAALAYITAHGGPTPAGWTILIAPGIIEESIAIPPNFLDLSISSITPFTNIWSPAAAAPAVPPIQWTGANQDYGFFHFNGLSFVSPAAQSSVVLNGLAGAVGVKTAPEFAFTDCVFGPAGLFSVNAQQMGFGTFTRCVWDVPSPVLLSNCDACVADDCPVGGNVSYTFDPTQPLANADTAEGGSFSLTNGSAFDTITMNGPAILRIDATSSLIGGLDLAGISAAVVGTNGYFPQFFVHGTLGLFDQPAPFSASIPTPGTPGGIVTTVRPILYDFDNVLLNGTLNFTAVATTTNLISARGLRIDPTHAADVLPIVGVTASGPGITVDLRGSSINPGRGSPLAFVDGQVTATAPAVAIVSQIVGTSNLLPGNPAPNSVACACPFLLATSIPSITTRILGVGPGTGSVPPGATFVPGVGFSIFGVALDTADFYWTINNPG